MIYESFSNKDSQKEKNLKINSLLVLSIATSLDALAVGFSLPLMKLNVFLPSVMIGIITFILSLFGICIGKLFGHFLEEKAELFGGVILIIIGFLILTGL